jgi:hypothetical protein
MSGIHGTLEVRDLKVVLTDDTLTAHLGNPLNPGSSLFGIHNRTRTTTYYAQASLSFRPHGEVDANLLLLAPGPQRLQAERSIRLASVSAATLDGSHVAEGGSAPITKYDDTLHVGDSLQLDMPAASHTPEGTQTGRAWGWTLTVESAGSTDTYETGHSTTAPADLPLGQTDHYVFADFTFNAAGGTLDGPARVFSPAASLQADGSLRFEDAHGRIASKEGVASPDHVAVSTQQGTFLLNTASGRVAGNVQFLPETVTHAVPPSASVIYWAWAFGFIFLLGVALAPSLLGWQKTAGPQRLLRARAEAFAGWASEADARGWPRLAALLGGRAVANAPKVLDWRVEHAIFLRQAHRPRAALRQHRVAEDLRLQGADPGYGALNAYHASLASAELGQDDDALEWLQAALERDPGLAAETAHEPRFRRLRGHPDYEAMVQRQ